MERKQGTAVKGPLEGKTINSNVHPYRINPSDDFAYFWNERDEVWEWRRG